MDQGCVRQVPAREVGEGERIVQPDGTATPPVMTVEWTDYDETADTPWRVVLWLDDGDSWDLPADTVLSVVWYEDAPDIPVTRPAVVGDGTDPVIALLRGIAHRYAGTRDIERLAARVARGFTTDSGRAAVAELGGALYLRHDDPLNALAVCSLVTQEPPNLSQWTWTRQALGLTHHLALLGGDTALAADCRQRLQAGTGQRWLDYPPLNRERIARVVASGNQDAEVELRSTDLLTLMAVRGAGGRLTQPDQRFAELFNDEIARIRRTANGA